MESRLVLVDCPRALGQRLGPGFLPETRLCIDDSLTRGIFLYVATAAVFTSLTLGQLSPALRRCTGGDGKF